MKESSFFFSTVFPSLDLCYTEDTKANVTVLDLKDVYDKGQSRRKANSEQRLLKADVRLKATAQKQIQVFIVNNGKRYTNDNLYLPSVVIIAYRIVESRKSLIYHGQESQLARGKPVGYFKCDRVIELGTTEEKSS